MNAAATAAHTLFGLSPCFFQRNERGGEATLCNRAVPVQTDCPGVFAEPVTLCLRGNYKSVNKRGEKTQSTYLPIRDYYQLLEVKMLNFI